MIGKEWTREFFDEYIIWLEYTLFKILQKYNVEELEKSKSETEAKENGEILDDLDKKDKQCNDEGIINSFKNIIDSLGINTKENFIEYLLQSINNKRYPEMAFLLDVNYIDDCDMNNFYFSLLEKDGKIIINKNDKIKGLKLLLSEFLYQCGYDDVLKFQQSLLNNKINEYKSSETIDNKKQFNNVRVVANDGEQKNIDVSYKTLRGLTTWYAVRGKASSKITKNRNGKFGYREGDKFMKIIDSDVIEYISKDYN